MTTLLVVMGFPLHLFDSGLDDSYLCWICKQVLDNPLAVPCGHVFCSSCVEPWVTKSNSCPCDCDGKVAISDLNQVQPLDTLIGKLTSKCSNHDKGCQFSGQLRDAKLHLKVCPFATPITEPVSIGQSSVSCASEQTMDDIETIDSLKKRAKELKEEIQSLKSQLEEQNSAKVYSSGNTKYAEDMVKEDSIHLSKEEYNILQVNGEDLSTASHEAAAEAFKRAAEPITVVLRRNNSNGHSNVGPCHSPKTAATSQKDRFSASTQTAQDNNGMCFCQFLIENCRKMPDRLSSLIMSELLRYKLTATNPHLCNDVSDSFAPGSPANDEVYLPEEDDDVFGIHYEEVTLKRPSSQDKLGIMLCDHVDRLSGATQVIVNEVAPESIAARSQSIFEGDQIVKVNGIPVHSMNEASRLLRKDNAVITFLICRQHIVENEDWREENESTAFTESKEERVLHDVTNFDRDETGTTTSEESRPRYLEHKSPERCVEYAAIVSQKLSCEAMGTTDSGTSHSSTTACSQNEKDSGFGQTTDGTVQSTVSKSTNDNRRFGTTSSGGSSSHSAAREFTYVPVQKYHQKKRPAQHKAVAGDSGDSAKGSMERSIPEERESDLSRLNQAIESLEVNQTNTIPTPNNPFDGEDCDNVSPWVKIAMQDYQEKIRQYENTGDARVIHPALPADADGLLSNARSESVATDNTSSAYSTGDSFRSSSSASGQRLSSELQTPPLSPEKQIYDSVSPYYNVCTNELPPYTGKHHGVTMSYYVSSDGNSDGEGPACYLTHDDDSGSEGFADAGLEFSQMFTSALGQHPKLQHSKSAPVPVLNHPAFANNFMSQSVTASTKQLCKAAAHVAQTRRSTASSGEIPSDCTDKSKSSSRTRTGSQRENVSTDSMSGQTVITHTNENCQQVEMPHPKPFPRHKARRSSEQIKQPILRPAAPNRSQSYTEGQVACKTAMDESLTGSNGDVSSEWKVRVRNDGTRYITKRPVRERLLKEREQRLLAERCGITTDDDAATELKLGRHWTRDERKRHMRIAREKRRRKDFMQRCRLEALNENAPADGEIVELSHKKMTRRKHKRMLLDNFVTVQEILAHGDRTTSANKVNPLLSVTYI
uniref:E3 ubiquitin-protein ligase PDZRN3-like n=1 Tax=Phallusia mammillata TaxID=59560 RepID=A0A6F9DP47_9ASCI|nr:E3 ubiquitin-protein ligase PDZRN3-like [Phallusia mammillata]